MDFYQILNVSRSASQEELLTAYRNLAKATHPDTHPHDPDATQKFRRIVEAFETLSDPNKRAIYNGKNPPKIVRPPKQKKGSAIVRNHDPNLGRIVNVPPSKYDLWGNLIVHEESFKDSVKNYEDKGSSPYIR